MTSSINLILGDCLDVMKTLPDGCVDAVVTDPLLPVLDFHVARLAQTDQVIKGVGFLDSAKDSERFNVMHRNRVANDFAAGLTSSFVTFDRIQTRLEPTLAAIGSDAAYPLRGVLARHVFGHVTGMAFLGAEAQAGLGFVLSGKPGFDFKVFVALRALVSFVLDNVNCLGLLTCKGVGRSKAGAPFVAILMVIWHFAISHVPFAATFKTAKTRFVRSIRLYLEGCAADLTRLGYHASIIPQVMGSGTTGVACVQTERDFIGVEISEEYFKIAQKRIADAQLQPPLLLV